MVIDKAQALERLAGNEALFEMLTKKFADQYQTSADELTLLIEQEQLKEAATLVHSIKGAAGNLSMNVLLDSAKQLEHRLHDKADIMPALIQFNQDLAAVITHVRN